MNSTPICERDENLTIDAVHSSVQLTENSKHMTQDKSTPGHEDGTNIIFHNPKGKELIQSSEMCLKATCEQVSMTDPKDQSIIGQEEVKGDSRLYF